MNIEKDFDSDSDSNPHANEVMTTAMDAIHDILMQPMKEKLTTEEHGVLALIAITLKIIAEKATAYEKMEQGELSDLTKNDFYRN